MHNSSPYLGLAVFAAGIVAAAAGPADAKDNVAEQRRITDARSHDTTTAAFAQGLGWEFGRAQSSPATITIQRDAQGKVSDIRFNVPGIGSQITNPSATGVDISTGRQNAAAQFVANPATRFNAPPVNSTVTAPPFGASWAVAEYLSYSTFGAWQDPPTNTIGGIAGGQLTPIRAMPKLGSATFNGKALGVLQTGHSLDVSNSLISGDAKIAANWGNGTVTTHLTNLTSTTNNPSFPLLSGQLNGSAPINGNRFTGPMSGSLQIGTTQPATSMSGSQQGQFNGPRAQEVAGTWSATGVTFGSAVNAAGSFAAKR